MVLTTSNIREALMTDLRKSRFDSCSCGACGPVDMSRRAFLCTSAAGAIAAPALAAGMAAPALAQQTPAAASGGAILIKGGCVLSLDRAVGDFDQADVLIE